MQLQLGVPVRSFKLDAHIHTERAIANWPQYSASRASAKPSEHMCSLVAIALNVPESHANNELAFVFAVDKSE